MTNTLHESRYGHSAQRPCPDWCTECEHNLGPDGAFYHRGPAHTVTIYTDNAQAFIPMTVRPEYFEKLPEDRGPEHDPPDLEAPLVRLEAASGVEGSLTPEAARDLAQALIDATDIIAGRRRPLAEP